MDVGKREDTPAGLQAPSLARAAARVAPNAASIWKSGSSRAASLSHIQCLGQWGEFGWQVQTVGTGINEMAAAVTCPPGPLVTFAPA